MERIKVGVLGASGAVGQRIVSLLIDHPWFEIGALGSAASRPLPAALAETVVQATHPSGFAGCRLIFSALPAEVAHTVEPAFAQAGFGVVSNASSFRMAEDVPLMIPEANADHLALIARQRESRGWRGYIVTNPN
jgi:aspartate-semialdehyde dehydrogenase